jgi:hypothetical protein
LSGIDQLGCRIKALGRKAKAVFLLSFAVLVLKAETGTLLVEVKDAQGHPIRGIEIKLNR